MLKALIYSLREKPGTPSHRMKALSEQANELDGEELGESASSKIKQYRGLLVLGGLFLEQKTSFSAC